MIKPEELRIGNWVHHKKNWSYRQSDRDFKEFDFQWDESDWYALGECTLFFESDISPLPLTPEWLEKFGFEMMLENMKLEDTPKGVIRALPSDYKKENIVLHAGHHEYYFGWGIGLDTKLEYVHQVQNLYFALTNKELTIKP